MSVESPASQFYSSPWAMGSVKSSQSSSQTRNRSVSEVTEGPPLKKPKIEGAVLTYMQSHTLVCSMFWSSVVHYIILHVSTWDVIYTSVL